MKSNSVSKMIEVANLTGELVAKKLKNTSDVDEVRINISTGQKDKNGIDVHWDVEIDHPDDHSLDRKLAFDLMTVAASGIDKSEVVLRDFETPHLNIVIKLTKTEDEWQWSVKPGFIKGWPLKFFRLLKSLF